MPEKLKKIEKDFVLSDSSINVYGFRLLTSGYLIDEYLKSPIGFYMHDRDSGVLVRWDDVRVVGDKVMGKPVINLSHPRGQQTVDEIENGFLNAASVGDIVVLENEDIYDAYLQQSVLTVTQWYNKECSLVDMPGNRNAFVTKLYDTNGQEINLADFINNKPQAETMKQIPLTITPALIAMLGLADGKEPAAADITNAIKNLSDRAAAADDLELQVKNLSDQKKTAETAKTAAETALQNLKDETVTKRVTNLLDAALTAKKISVKLKDRYAKDYANDPEGLEEVLKEMGAYKSVVDDLSDNSAEKVPADIAGKNYMELHSMDRLQEVRDKYPSLFDKLQSEWKAKRV